MLDQPQTPVKAKSFTWSWSRLKNYETCPRRYYEIDVVKTIEQPKTEPLIRGEELHTAMEHRVNGTSALPAHLIYMEPWAEKLTALHHPYQIIQCELKLSMDKDGKPTSYFDKNTWFRTKIDYLKTVPTKIEGVDFGHVVDYKTGKLPKAFDTTQLMLNAWSVFQHYKTVQQVRVDYLWTEYNDTTHEDFARGEIAPQLAELMPRVVAMQTAHATGVFPPRPCGLCYEYCDVVTCEFHGKRQRK